MCQRGLVEYAARCYGTDKKRGPEIVSFECVQQAYSQGKDLMRTYLELLRKETGQPYQLTHVLMSGASIGAAQLRKRYFWVAHRIPFGVEVESPRTPVTVRDAIQDLVNLPLRMDSQRIRRKPTAWSALKRNATNTIDWHVTLDRDDKQTNIELVIDVLKENPDWEPGEYINTVLTRAYRRGTLPSRAYKFVGTDGKARGWGGPVRVNPDVPGRVIHGGGATQFIHWEESRYLTMRELTRLMGYPDDWSFPEVRNWGVISMWLGKNAPIESCRWLSYWAKQALEGAPGRLRGVPDPDAIEQMINVTHAYQGPHKIEAEEAE
jgi:site-specific DNA-cytosine methylase